MDHLALACRVSGEDFRRANMYNEGDSTHFGTVLGEKASGKWNVPSMWDRLQSEVKLSQRRAEIDEFNAKNKWAKRGSSLTPTKFGIAFTAKYMNQGMILRFDATRTNNSYAHFSHHIHFVGGALVHLYTDGTVLVSHGGTEMGQGLHTKVCQVAAQAFEIPVEHVYVNDSSTDKVANTIPTAAVSKPCEMDGSINVSRHFYSESPTYCKIRVCRPTCTACAPSTLVNKYRHV